MNPLPDLCNKALENDYLPENPERQISTFVDVYNNQEYHESLNNITPADAYFGYEKAILRERKQSRNKLSAKAAYNIKNKPNNQP